MSYWQKFFGLKKPIEIPTPSEGEIKNLTSVLFVDDNEFQVVQIFINHGWSNTKRVSDVSNLDDGLVRQAHVLFIDIQGVGRALGFADEGLGLSKALKERYPSKRVIVYSAESKGERFHEGLYTADASIKKNVDPVVYLKFVEKYSREFFTFEACAARIQHILSDNFNVRLSQSETEKIIRDIAKRRAVSDKNIADAFGISSAGSIASLLSLFLQITVS